MKIISIDIGGTNTRVVGFEKELIKFSSRFITIKNFENEIKEIVNIIINNFIDFDGIAISAPGPANYETGEFGELPNLPWNGKNIISEFKKYFSNLKIVMQNDANLMALAHHRYFRQKHITSFFTISTGLGAGLVIDNKIFTGVHGLAQEIANLPCAFSKESGKNLGEGSVEYFSSGSGIAERTKMDVKEAFMLYGKNKSITKIINEGIDALANLVAITTSLIDPALIVFDGSIARNHRWYVDTAVEIAKTRMFKVQAKHLNYSFAELGDDAAIFGALYHFKNHFK